MQLKIIGDFDKAVKFAEEIKGMNLPGFKGYDKRRGEVKIDLRDDKGREEALEKMEYKVRTTGLTIEKTEIQRS